VLVTARRARLGSSKQPCPSGSYAAQTGLGITVSQQVYYRTRLVKTASTSIGVVAGIIWFGKPRLPVMLETIPKATTNDPCQSFSTSLKCFSTLRVRSPFR
jgi:hypothetical protein